MEEAGVNKISSAMKWKREQVFILLMVAVCTWTTELELSSPICLIWIWAKIFLTNDLPTVQWSLADAFGMKWKDKKPEWISNLGQQRSWLETSSTCLIRGVFQ